MSGKTIRVLAIALLASVPVAPTKEADDPTSSELPNGDLLVGDFEQRDLGRVRAWGWQLDGNAFNREFQHGTRQLRARVGRYAGRWFLSSLGDGNAATGVATSPPFKIDRPFVEFRLSGGADAEDLTAKLLIDGKAVRSATGANDDLFEHSAFAVAEFAGKEARFQIIDRSTKGIWGHINIDHIVQTERPHATRVIDTPPAAAAWKRQGFAQASGDGKRLAGPFAVRAGKLVSADGQTLGLDDTLLLVTENPPAQQGNRDALLLANGERWFGRIAGLENGEVMLHGGALGHRKLPLGELAALEFNVGKIPAAVSGEANTLYREAGEPVPGKLVWIRDKDIAIDCALGVIPVPRAGVRRFVINPEPARKTSGGDELALTDGSVLRGATRLQGERVVLEHPVLGELQLEIGKLSSLRRHPAGVRWLSRMRPASFQSDGPLLSPPRPRHINDGERSSLRVHPNTSITYEVPTLGAAPPRFHATLAAAAGNRGRAKVSASCGDALFEAVVEPGSEPRRIDLPLQGGAVLQLQIEFVSGDRLAFPCAIDWREAHIAAQATNPTAPNTPTN